MAHPGLTGLASGVQRSLEIDLSAVVHNVGIIRDIVGPVPRIYASLKADAYGYGLLEIASAAVSAGANALAVGSGEDALRLRDAGVSVPLLVYFEGVPGAPTVRALTERKVAVTVVDGASATEFAARCSDTLEVFVKIDVGLQRLGCQPEEALSLITRVARDARLRLGGVYTHLDTPDDPPPGYLRWQLKRFAHAVQVARAAGLRIPIAMAASSGVLTREAGAVFDAVDPGRLLYGLGPSSALPGLRPFRQALVSLKSRLVQVKPLLFREKFADTGPFTWRPGMRVGVLPMGRWHGLDRASAGQVLVRGCAVPLLGGVSIEHCRVDLTAVPDAAPGDEVVIIGRQGDECISLAEVTAATGAISPLDVTLAMGGRVERLYVPAV